MGLLNRIKKWLFSTERGLTKPTLAPDLVHSVILPENRPFSGCYALIRPGGDQGYPNFEDYILIARRVGSAF